MQPQTVSRVGQSYRPKPAPKRATFRHYPQTIMNGKCVRLVPCDDLDRLQAAARSKFLG